MASTVTDVRPAANGWPVAAAWVCGYLAFVLAPLAVLVAGPRPPGLGFWWDLSMAFGFAAIAMMAVQFVLTARFRRTAAPFGIDIVYYFHRYQGVLALALVLAHPLVAWIDNPAIAGYVDPREAPGHMTAGVVSAVAVVALVFTSFMRRWIGLSYEVWRLTHVALSVTAVGLAFAHVHGIQYYTATSLMGAWVSAVAAFCLAIAVFVRVIRPWLLARRPFRVVSVTPERGDAWTVALQPERGAGMSFQPGQFAWLTIGHSPYGMREHPFSFSSGPTEPGARLEFTIKELGDFTRTVGSIRPGSRAYVDGPYGAFTIDRHPAARYVFIAGGIGIAPLLSMLRALADRRSTTPVLLLYGHNQWERMTGREALDELRDRLNLTVVYVVNQPPPDWTGERGWITHEVLARHLPDGHQNAEYFICGPQGMTLSMEHLLHGLGVPLSRLHSEFFELV